MALIIELNGADGMLALREALPYHKIEKILQYQAELKRNPKDRERENADKALDKLLESTGGILEISKDKQLDLSQFKFSS